jgi:hypothetical protein
MADNGDKFVVIAPLACVTDKSGKLHYLYYGSPVVVDMEDDLRDRYVNRGLIAKVVESDPHPPAEITLGQLDPSDVLSAPEATTTGPAEAGSAFTPAPELVERPAAVAPKDVWEDYAVKRGMSRERAASLSKRQIMDTYPVDAR